MIVEGGEGGWVGEDIGHCLGTPEVSVFDGRGLRIGRVEYNRRTAAEALRRVWERHEYDASGRMVASRDGRLGAVKGGTANLAVAYSLSGRIVRRDSVDNGVRVSLADVSGAEVLSLDGRGSWRRTQYDVLARPVSLHEGGCDEGEGEAGPSRCMLVADAPASGTPWQEAASHGGRCVERIVYGMGGEAATRNQCGRILCHDDAGGRRRMQGYALSGAVLLETQRFVRAEVLALGGPDWPRDAGEGDGLLDDSCHTSAWSYDALGGEVTMTDAAGHVRRTAYDVAGQVRTRGLKLAGQDKEQIVAGGFVYGADGKLEKEQAGNGVATHYVYAAATRRLMGAMTVREGDGRVLADRTYTYDPVGNILAIEDKAQSVHYGRNRQIAPVWRHRYDARYQLIETFGRESVQAGLDERLPQALRLRVGDAGQLVPYRRSYHYDAGGNLTELAHAGAHSYTQRFVVSSCSNRTLPQMDGLTAAAVAAGFDANGNLHDLAPGQALSWDARNQLQKVVLVGRGDAEADDAETYVYDGGGRRLIKTRTFLTAPGQHSEQVRYLPGLELRTNSQTGEVLQVVEAGDRLRVLVWQAGKPKAIASPQWRYSLTDHLGSLHLELDAEALLISREEYYPHGGTAVWTTRSHVEAPYKHRRHAGKERDASGLYYYGLRYLSPGSHQRWINPDPANEIDGLNLYWFCRNNPVTLTDELGNAPTVPNSQEVSEYQAQFEHARQLARAKLETAAALFVRPETEVINTIMNSFLERGYTIERVRSDIKKVLKLERIIDVGRNVRIEAESGKTLAWYDKRNNDAVQKYVRDPYGNTDGLGDTILFGVNPLMWRKDSDATNSTAIIHELSHAALQTEDYMYVTYSANLIPIRTPLVKLAQKTASDRDKKFVKSIWPHLKFSKDFSASKNAETFAQVVAAAYHYTNNAYLESDLSWEEAAWDEDVEANTLKPRRHWWSWNRG